MSDAIRLELDATRLAWLWFDSPKHAVNVLTTEVLEAFDQALTEIGARQPRGLVIASARDSGFIAGADVKAFAGITGVSPAQRHISQVHDILQRLEDLGCPTVAAIHGFCLGGGLELALACDYRVCSDDPATRLGFPEVELGIFPGYGGTLRATRLLGDLPALRLMLEGRRVDARTARRIGLVDLAVPQRQLHAAARTLVDERAPPRRAGTLARLPATWPLRPLIGAVLRRRVAGRVVHRHYPAPFALLRHWQDNAGDARAMLRGEASTVAELVNSPTARNLIRVFMLQERLKAQGDRSEFDLRHVHVVGGGVMGGDIAAWCALKGFRVTLQDRAPEYLGRAVQRAHALFRRHLRDRYALQGAVDRLMPDHLGAGAAVADVVIEAIFEDGTAKQTLYAALEPRMRPDALLATNTSSIPLEQLAGGLARPERLVGLHFFNPVAKMPLLEIVHQAATDPAALRRAAAFARHVDKLPLAVRSSPGFLVNRVLMPYLLEALALLEEGVAAERVDRAALDFGMPMGPVELADTVGLDICLAVAEKMASALHNPVPSGLRERVAAGRLGRKTGRGFYTWSGGTPQRLRGTPRGSPVDAELCDRLVLRLVNESVACLREGLVADADLLDAGIVFGTGFAPFRGGPLHYARNRGSSETRRRLDELEARFGGQFHPDAGWALLS